ncbi:LysM domain-containing protein [Micromonospora sp. WMMA1363]|uniref:LysM peptidoglycan-binding domain-containing protein n=1 Tax=Micromonospora sp. WMMA1363 TaxID=3053985 RepID=UPI00259C7523|nr:LysM domain-containing protein [Micromonospora sp. WMMA1363]MDM4721942.1 LysM domain-containing protein [Micromonospora sp. WMMA1363]
MATPARTVQRILTGFGGCILLGALLVGAPVALFALAGNPLPEQVPTLAEVGAMLTSRDDGQLFLRALALVGWAGWTSFALSVLVELGALALRRPTPRLPGMRRQQRAAAALVGSVALILTASPAAAGAAAVTGPSAAAMPLSPPAAASAHTAPLGWPGLTGTALAAPGGPASAAGTEDADPAPGTPRSTAGRTDPDRGAPVYQVAKGDHLGSIAERYLDSFGEYRTLARLNRLGDPDRIHPGQLLRLPAEAEDRGARPHAVGRLAATGQAGDANRRTARPTPQPPPGSAPATDGISTGTPAGSPTKAAPNGPVVVVGAARPGEPDRVNRPLAVSAILAVSSIIGAQIGAALGLRRRPADARTGVDRGAAAGGHPRELPAGRHRRD